MLNYKGDMVEKKPWFKALISDVEDNFMIEVSSVASKDEASLIEIIFHESNIECRSIHWYLQNTLIKDGFVNYFKNLVGSTNPLS